MEPHGVAAEPAPDGRITVWTSNQFPHLVHVGIAAATGIPRERLHLVTPQVGGGFGGKAGLQHEYTVVVVAAERLGRAVTWIPSRSEDLMAKDHSRCQVQYAELGCRRDGTFTGLRVRLVGDGGAYPGIGAALPGGTRRMSHGTYDFPAIEFDVAVATTNTPPTGAYRGAGRPEATALLERLADQAARELDIDPIELRERNLLADDLFPFTTLTGNSYDSGRYRLPLRTAADAIGYDDLRREQAERRRRGTRYRWAWVWRPTWRSPAAAIRPSGEARDPRRRLGDDVLRHAVARPGPSDRLRDARERPDRHPGRSHLADRRRHGSRAAGRRHRGVTFTPARRLGGARGDGGRRRTCARNWPRVYSRQTLPTWWSTPGRAPWASPACRPAR